MLTGRACKIRIRPTDLISSPSGCLEATRVLYAIQTPSEKDLKMLDSQVNKEVMLFTNGKFPMLLGPYRQWLLDLP
jgi:hypothetical protein